ncbi:reverse transcriptase domain-containing protein [Rossellomorea marisflavi]|uniref:reverse transcriptase domain-containing protein n=1 Tax=Rossellomorea marisflavi TaxID=189381 RepID=UPI003D2AF6DF
MRLSKEQGADPWVITNTRSTNCMEVEIERNFKAYPSIFLEGVFNVVTSTKLINEYFDIDYIKSFYIENQKKKTSVGVDKINSRLFIENIDWYCITINRKILNGSYKFTPYKQKLISKGMGKKPRQISIPTIKDKTTLALLKEILQSKFQNDVYYETVHTIISDLENNLKNTQFNYYFKIDISDFYGSINHDYLLKKLKKRIRNDNVLGIIKRSLKTPTVKEGASSKEGKVNRQGVPQGLPISNILSSIYMSSLDRKYLRKDNIVYKRFVDDIIILCNSSDKDKIIKEIKRDIENDKTLDLPLNSDKGEEGNTSDGFKYLGYELIPESTTIRKEAIESIEKSLEKIFISFSHSVKKSNPNINFFIWQLNLRITGSKYNKKKFGWLLFYSQTSKNNEEIFHHLDWFVRKKLLKDRFELDKLIDENQIKRFSRAYNEIRNNFKNTSYLPNFDSYTLEDKIHFLEETLDKRTHDLSSERIDFLFNTTIYKEVSQLDKDIQEIS